MGKQAIGLESVVLLRKNSWIWHRIILKMVLLLVRNLLCKTYFFLNLDWIRFGKVSWIILVHLDDLLALNLWKIEVEFRGKSCWESSWRCRWPRNRSDFKERVEKLFLCLSGSALRCAQQAYQVVNVIDKSDIGVKVVTLRKTKKNFTWDNDYLPWVKDRSDYIGIQDQFMRAKMQQNQNVDGYD